MTVVQAIRSPLDIRSVELRRWAADLLDVAAAGLLVHGAGGIGKSTLAAQVTERVGRLESQRLTTVISGEVSADGFLAELAATLRRHPDTGPDQAQALAEASRASLPWERRLDALREHFLGRVPVLVLLDDFDDNLWAEPGGWVIRDRDLAGLLARWTGEPLLGRLLIVCRRPFMLPDGAESSLGFRYLGPLSRAEAIELAKSLPALGRLGPRDLDRTWRLTGGHPGVMRYLDTVLAGAEFEDVAARLAGEPAPEAPTELSPAEAEAVTVAAGDLLLGELYDRLSPGAKALLIGASVYRAPAGRTASLLPADQSRRGAELDSLADECAAAGLLTVEAGTFFVPRWTAGELHRRLVTAHQGDEVTAAHERAAEYWQARAATNPDNRRARLEARYHRLQVGYRAWREPPQASAVTDRTARTAGRRARLIGLAAGLAAVVALLAAGLDAAFSPGSSGTPDPAPGQLSASGPAGQTAAWVASQVSRSAVVACDPAMCSALQAHGIASGNLLTLRTGASSPSSADVVVATPAVRSQFGSRLASVYAPGVIASFGSGQARIDVRAVAPDGAAAYLAGLASDLAARKQAGGQLLGNPRITVPAAARAQLTAGRVDTRLLMLLITMAASQPVQVVSFSDPSPGASPGTPLRGAEVTVAGTGSKAAGLQAILAFARAQRPPYLPAQAAIAGGSVLSLQFAAPSPVGLLQATPLN